MQSLPVALLVILAAVRRAMWTFVETLIAGRSSMIQETFDLMRGDASGRPWFAVTYSRIRGGGVQMEVVHQRRSWAAKAARDIPGVP